MKYLVTGSTGVVGSYIVKELLKSVGPTDKIVALSRKYRYRYEDHPGKESSLLLECEGNLLLSCTRLITQYEPDVVFHCCGNGNQQMYFDTWPANVDTTLNILKALCLSKKLVKFINCSSIVVNDSPLTLYAASKQAGESLVNSFTDMYPDRILGTNIRLCAVAGAGNKHGVVKAVVDKLLDKGKDKLYLFTNSKKPLLYSGDLSNKLIELSNQINYPSLINICSPNSINVSYIAYLAMQKTGIKKEIVWSDKSWQGDQQDVQPVKSYFNMRLAEYMCAQAIDDILRKDYGYSG